MNIVDRTEQTQNKQIDEEELLLVQQARQEPLIPGVTIFENGQTLNTSEKLKTDEQ